MCFGVGVLLNLYLMLLIHKRREAEMKVYRGILYQMCVLDLYTLTVSAFVQPVSIGVISVKRLTDLLKLGF